MLTIAKKYNQMVSSVEFIEGSALALPFDDDEFDLIVCSRFIGYIPTVEQAKKIFYEFHRVGKQHLYIGVQYLRENVAHGKEDKLGHKMNRVDLIKFIKEVGFSVLGSTLLEAKDNYQNEILMLRKYNMFSFQSIVGALPARTVVRNIPWKIARVEIG